MSTTLALLLVVAGSYLAAHVAFEWLGRRFHVVSGAEYLLLGILLGPEVSGLLRPGVVGGFAPFMTLALGWIGAVVGAQFFLPVLVRIPAYHFRVALTEALLSFAIVGAVMAGALVGLVGVDPGRALLPALTFAAVATVSAPSGIALASRRAGRTDAVVRQLEVTTAVDAAVAVVAAGILMAVFHASAPPDMRPPTATEWAVITVAIGVVGGILFHLFLGGERRTDRLFVGLAGAIILASGAAAYLRLSPLLPTLLIGALLANTAPNRAEVKEVLARIERPLYFVLLIFAGASWRPDELWPVPVLVFLVARAVAKLAAAAGASWLADAHPVLGTGWGRALLGQGGLAVAIALGYHLNEAALHPDLVFTAAIVSVLLTDFASARLAGTVVPSRPARPAPRPDR